MDVPSSNWAGHEKKTLIATEQDEEIRVAWRVRIEQDQQENWRCVDACGTHIVLMPLSTRSPQGAWACGHRPCNYGITICLIASLSANGMREASF
ncbi:hypothetical protein EI42_06390 [Thermosporothrix hazakensis]|jgi:hypothetical protein|uniref:Uncharacterized protein n=1 Tax=Thermosporothrix hazakensis TaxID=644383 RepID=A0A326U3F9_THEHA|nr:hypothetical protein [Thermosporothrix hazakensis]PZW18042.1 hypothetical protein EI42_06390 [Thermosporothrix hazakensis]